MRKLILFLAFLLFACITVFSQTDRNTRYVAVQGVTLKSSTGFFASNLGSLAFGDAVTLISENGKWSQIRAGNQTGWVASNQLSVRRVVTTSSTGASAAEVALAGKGFSSEMELEYRKNGLDYTLVDEMERMSVTADELLRFINEGRLSKGE